MDDDIDTPRQDRTDGGYPFDFVKLIPELAMWNNGDGISVDAWISCIGSFEHAVGYSRLFWPEFMTHDGCVFFAGGFSKSIYRDFMDQCNGDRPSVEKVMNHRHLLDYFPQAEQTATEAQLIYLGRVLKEMWQAKLTRDFPNGQFIVSFPEGPFDDLTDYEVTFWQATDADAASAPE